MTDVKVEQCDEAAVDDGIETLTWQMSNFRPAAGESAALCYERRLREVFLPILARHRQAAEKAQQERDAGIADEMAAMRQRLYEDNPAEINAFKAVAFEEIATAIRSQNDDR